MKGSTEKLRLRAEKLAAAAASLKRRSGVIAPFSLAFMTDQKRAADPLSIARALPPGCAVILRDYDLASRAELAAALKSICAERALILVVGADIALAEAAGADGVHMPSWFDMSAETPPGMIRTAACHDAEELARARANKADIAILGPVFATASHPGAHAIGAKVFQELAAGAGMPVIAIGGVDENSADALAGPNVAGLAAIGAFLD